MALGLAPAGYPRAPLAAALVLISYTLLAHWLHQHQFSLTRRLKIFAIALAALMTPALQLALLYMELGFYWLVNGERLVLTQPGGDMITVGSIEIH